VRARRRSMLWRGVVCLLLTGCLRRQIVWVPDTTEGNACTAQCMEKYHSCARRLDHDFCVRERDQCLVTCPGAKMVDDPND
jgi:hypothetical protein